MFKRTINYLQDTDKQNNGKWLNTQKTEYKNFKTNTGTKKMTDQDRREKFEELCRLANNFDLEEYSKKEKKENKDPNDSME
jgi:hypothetical protein